MRPHCVGLFERLRDFLADNFKAWTIIHFETKASSVKLEKTLLNVATKVLPKSVQKTRNEYLSEH